MAKFRSKPIEIEAWAFNDFQASEHSVSHLRPGNGTAWMVLGKQGWVSCYSHNMIIKEPDGSGFYPCAIDVFAQRYEPVT